MPEHSEIRVLTLQVKSLISNKKVHNVTALDSKYQDIVTQFQSYLGREIVSVYQHGKKMYWDLGAVTATFGFGMTGSFTKEKTKHSRVEFEFKDTTKLYFTDIRKFGSLKLEKMPILCGIDPVGAKFTVETLKKLFQANSKQRVGEYLLDQNGLAGIGNYLRAEILYRAKVRPWVLCDSLTDQDIENIHRCTQEILQESYQAGGATIATYRSLKGIGSFSDSFKVYKKAKDPFGNPVVRELDKTKRAMWWCPAIQK